MTQVGGSPDGEEFEITLFGPGYGEGIVLHTGDGRWAIIDSCTNADGEPLAFRYLQSIGVDPTNEVDLIVATHWHDDHIRGMAALVRACKKATFCCASVLCDHEFLAITHALEKHHFSSIGSGVHEIHEVFSHLASKQPKPVFAIANRRILSKGACEIWSLSPRDSNFLSFLRSINQLLPSQGRSKRRIPSLSPNRISVVLWIKLADIIVLLGSDLEKPGWIEILQDTARPNGKASVFKVAHHGSQNAHEPRVWRQMLEDEPVAVVTPWRIGHRSLPSQQDVQRILSCTPNAYATTKLKSPPRSSRRRSNMIRRTLRESGIELRRISGPTGMIRIRWSLHSQDGWRIEKIGSACHLEDFVT